MEMENALYGLIESLRSNPDFRKYLTTLLTLLDEIDRAETERDDAIKIANKLMTETSQAYEKAAAAVRDKAALVAFIEDHVTDPDALEKIFPKTH